MKRYIRSNNDKVSNDELFVKEAFPYKFTAKKCSDPNYVWLIGRCDPMDVVHELVRLAKGISENHNIPIITSYTAPRAILILIPKFTDENLINEDEGDELFAKDFNRKSNNN